MSSVGVGPIPSQTVPELFDAGRPPRSPTVRRIARLRIPLTLTVRPWASLYRFPDGRRIWCVRLLGPEGVRVRCVTGERLIRYARESGLADLAGRIERAERRASRVRKDD